MDVITSAENAQSAFQASFERLQAVESVTGIISAMTESTAPSSLGLPEQAQLEALYLQSSPMVQKRFDAICDDLAGIARTGAQALLQLKSEGRTNLDAAADLLMREIGLSSRQILSLIRT